MLKLKIYTWVNTGNLIDSVGFVASVVQTHMPKHRLWPRFVLQLIFGMCFNLFSGYFSRSEGWGIDCLWVRETLTASGQAEREFTSLFRSGQLMPEFGQESVSLMKGFKVVHRYKQTEERCMQDGLRFYSKFLPSLWRQKILLKWVCMVILCAETYQSHTCVFLALNCQNASR